MPQPPNPNQLDAFVERTLAPYRSVLAPELLEEFRRNLVFALTTHPTAINALHQLRDLPALDHSAALVTDDSAGEQGQDNVVSLRGKR